MGQQTAPAGDLRGVAKMNRDAAGRERAKLYLGGVTNFIAIRGAATATSRM